MTVEKEVEYTQRWMCEENRRVQKVDQSKTEKQAWNGSGYSILYIKKITVSKLLSPCFLIVKSEDYSCII
jgi:hypothetical protein